MRKLKSFCRLCKSPIKGRTDKIFCSVACKNDYHTRLRAVTREAAIPIDRILHRNRSILIEIMGKNKTQVKVPRQLLDNKKFNYKYHTHTYLNSKGKLYRYVYDFGWMEFSDQEILITRLKKKSLV